MSTVVKMKYTKEIENIKTGSIRGYSIRGIKEGAHPPKVDTISRNIEDDPELQQEAKDKAHQMACDLYQEDLFPAIPSQDHPNFPNKVRSE